MVFAIVLARQGRERGEASVPPFDRSASEEKGTTRRTVPDMAAPGRPARRWRLVQAVKSLLHTPIAVMKEWGGARALRTDRGERLAVRRSPTRFRCGFFGPLQLHARRSGRCACGGVVPITLTVARNCARAKLERQRHRSTPAVRSVTFPLPMQNEIDSQLRGWH